jgi:hypothetical protein
MLGFEIKLLVERHEARGGQEFCLEVATCRVKGVSGAIGYLYKQLDRIRGCRNFPDTSY